MRKPDKPLAVLIAALAIISSMSGGSPARADALGEDEQAYAAYVGVSADVAQRHLALQRSVESVAPALEADPRVTAFWIDRSSDWNLVVGVRDPNQGDDVLQILPSAIRTLTRLTQQSVSASELGAFASQVQEAAQTLGIEASASVDVKTERVVVTVASGAFTSRAETFRRALDPAGKIKMDLVVSPQDLPRPATLYGGIDERTCTMGFSVTNGTVRGLTTAAHCDSEPAIVWGHSLPMQKAWYDAQRDVQWHAGIQNYTNLIYDGEGSDPTRRITAQIGRLALVTEGVYCKRGQTTGYSCGYLASKNEPTPPYIPAGTKSNTWLAIDGPYGTCQRGDSGGPVFSGNAAVGFLSGCASSGKRVVAMSVDALTGTGISILRVP